MGDPGTNYGQQKSRLPAEAAEVSRRLLRPAQRPRFFHGTEVVAPFPGAAVLASRGAEILIV
jgi:hypothetical protein